MDENLISKRELLEATGISYGALYRWKRMRLIPDEWFIRRSTYTGSETFFPREQILERVQQIQQLKSGMSLEEIAQAFNGDHTQVSLSFQAAAARGVAGPQVMDLWLSRFGNPDEAGKEADFSDLLSLRLLHRLLESGQVDRNDALDAAALCRNTEGLQQPQLVVLRKLGVATLLLKEEGAPLRFGPGSTEVFSISLPALSGELRDLLGKESAQ